MKGQNSGQKLYVVIGTRAQLIKMAPVMKEMQERGVDYEFVYTAQHQENIQETIDVFELKPVDKILYNRDEANTIFKFFGWGVSMIFKLFSSRRIFKKNSIILTHGDTATCAWTAVAGRLAGCRVWHVESGLRSFNIFSPFPEELMRLTTFRFSQVYFAPNEWALNNLKKYKGEKVNTKGNTLLDSVRMAVNSKVENKFGDEKNYVVVSIHRYENIFKKRFEEVIIPLLEMIASKGFKLIFVLHPTTREVLKKDGGRLYKRLEGNENIILTERLPFPKFIKLFNDSEFVITDGGSNQEELSYLGKPTLIFRDHTERVEGLDKNIVLSKFNEELIVEFVDNYKKYELAPIVNDSKFAPSKIIVDYIQKIQESK